MSHAGLSALTGNSRKTTASVAAMVDALPASLPRSFPTDRPPKHRDRVGLIWRLDLLLSCFAHRPGDPTLGPPGPRDWFVNGQTKAPDLLSTRCLRRGSCGPLLTIFISREAPGSYNDLRGSYLHAGGSSPPCMYLGGSCIVAAVLKTVVSQLLELGRLSVEHARGCLRCFQQKTRPSRQPSLSRRRFCGNNCKSPL